MADHHVLVNVGKVHGRTRSHVGLGRAGVAADIPALAGGGVHHAQLLFCGSPAVLGEVRTCQGDVGQTGDVTLGAVQRDRVRTALTHHDAAGVDHGGVFTIADAGRACRHRSGACCTGHGGACGARGGDVACTVVDGQATGIELAVARGHAARGTQVNVLGQVHRQIGTGLADHHVLVAVAEVHRIARGDLGRTRAIGAHVPALVGRGVHRVDGVVHRVLSGITNITHRE